MGNICSGCQRDKEDSRHTETYRYDKNIPISLFIEKQRTNYTDSVKGRLSRSYLDHLADHNLEKPIRIDKSGGLQEFWKKNTKHMKAFNPNVRPSATYQIDNNLAYRFLNRSSDKFESAYYDTDVIKLHSSASIIQKWFKKHRKNKSNTSNYFNSSNNFNMNSKTQITYNSMNTIDLSVRQY